MAGSVFVSIRAKIKCIKMSFFVVGSVLGCEGKYLKSNVQRVFFVVDLCALLAFLGFSGSFFHNYWIFHELAPLSAQRLTICSFSQNQNCPAIGKILTTSFLCEVRGWNSANLHEFQSFFLRKFIPFAESNSPSLGLFSFILILPSFVKGVKESNGLTLHFQ